MTQEYDTPSEAWYDVVQQIVRSRRMAHPRGLRILEHPSPMHFVINRPWAMPIIANGRTFRDAIGVIEGLSLVGQTSVPELVTDRVAAFRPFLNKSIFWGAYGPRAAGDIGNVVELLTRDPDSRQAVISLYDSDRDLGRPGVVDVPCTVALQFFVRDGLLDLWVMMRSNDAWLGLPYDIAQFTILQRAVAKAIGIAVGRYFHSAGSMHLYEKHWKDASTISRASQPHGLLDDWGLFGGAQDIGEIASRARRILLGQEVENPTQFETWAATFTS